MSSRVIHFEIHAEKPERAIAFYSGLFGWKFNKWEGPMPYWLIATGPDSEPGINGGLLQRMGPPPADSQAVNAYVCTTGTANIDASIEQAVKLGAAIAMPKTPIPGVGWLAYAKDPEGNLFGMMQPDPSASGGPPTADRPDASGTK